MSFLASGNDEPCIFAHCNQKAGTETKYVLIFSDLNRELRKNEHTYSLFRLKLGKNKQLESIRSHSNLKIRLMIRILEFYN